MGVVKSPTRSCGRGPGGPVMMETKVSSAFSSSDGCAQHAARASVAGALSSLALGVGDSGFRALAFRAWLSGLGVWGYKASGVWACVIDDIHELVVHGALVDVHRLQHVADVVLGAVLVEQVLGDPGAVEQEVDGLEHRHGHLDAPVVRHGLIVHAARAVHQHDPPQRPLGRRRRRHHASQAPDGVAHDHCGLPHHLRQECQQLVSPPLHRVLLQRLCARAEAQQVHGIHSVPRGLQGRDIPPPVPH
mmetsp:Transcript_52426/g.166749  ORF Transcript_52426/g.166749 Transcript_52426/m.166749 type:complete len:247 (-) Transcript_52426:404-1144(-)